MGEGWISGECTVICFARAGLVGAALTAAAGPAAAATIYVDGALTADCSSDYDPAARSCGAGSDTALRTIAAAVLSAQAGDVVEIRAGTYEEPLVAASSGTAAEPITFRAYAGEAAVIANIDDPAIRIIGQSYIVVEGLTVVDSLGWGRLEDATGIVVRGGTFQRATATGTTGGFKLVRTVASLLADNLFEDGNDNVVVQESDGNLLVGNRFVKGRHSLLSIRCSDRNVVRANRFSNPDQKAAEIYDCEAVSDAPYELDATRRNLFEQNVFEHTLGSDASHDYNAIQYAGQEGIVRRNVFYDCQGGGLHFQVYPDEALYNYGHRAYHNSFVENRCYGLGASADTDATRYHDNRAENNLLYLNVGCAGEPEQTSIGNATAVVLTDNVLATAPPGFVDEAGRDYHLVSTSALVDAARFLTVAVGDGSGTSLPVADASYFYDGNGIAGELGDEIQLEGAAAPVRVVAVDTTTGLLTLDQSVSWQDGQGVTLAFAGTAPDVGAFELGLAEGGSAPGGAGGTSPTGGSGGQGASPSGGGAGASVPPGAAPGESEEGGCGCRIAAETRRGRALGSALWALTLAAGLVRLRRHARRSDPRRTSGASR